MPARWLRPKYRHLFTLVALLFIVPASVAAQSSGTLRGTVSETVTLSVAPAFQQSNVNVVSSGRNTVRITLSGDDAKDQVIRVPLLVRSNSSFKISADFESTTAQLSQLSVRVSDFTEHRFSVAALHGMLICRYCWGGNPWPPLARMDQSQLCVNHP